MSTQTVHVSSGSSTNSVSSMPSSLPFDGSAFPKLNKEQAGHIRHYHNLASMPDNCWDHMWSEDYLQESMDAYRYQLATLVYGAGIAHFHRLPALRSVFKPLLRRFIQKMLLRDVWAYWWNTSQGGKALNPDQVKPRAQWADPVMRENIMYSGHLLLMVSLYAMLFDDDEYERPGSMTFDWDPQFWGTPEKYEYSTKSLQDVIIAEMEKNQWLGVCCEPNVVFVICNQFPLVAIRYNDVRNGTHIFDDIKPKFLAAWEKKKGMLGPNGQIIHMWMVQQDDVVTASSVIGSAWCGAYMNAWHSDFVYSIFEKQRIGHLTNINGQVRLQSFWVAKEILKLSAQDPVKHHPDNAATVAEATRIVKEKNPEVDHNVAKAPGVGMVLQWLSELGKEEYLSPLLEYIDQEMHPKWENGGLFYERRNDFQPATAICMDPYSSNAGIAYGRLNVHNGQKDMFERPWTKETLARRPYVDNVDLSLGVDFLRGQWSAENSALIVTLKSWDGQDHEITPTFNNLSQGPWGLYINDQLQRVEDVVEGSGSVSVVVRVPATEEVDLVLLRGQARPSKM
ncbi:uncharacterized protein A1O9_04449 [Exophiala aquamarina CBS 119918]|uniref:Linalool dehydratase/isomerase domain-containing protein n=1 Tax=Exophiala aquamarina CBS 119918 TaxID=1182545 RepID=A0A072PJV0_9EURO|nr:uncharacterized protein A1O9_04449 [Exophiala aquamarina CBS 119918]KEF59603.1 hypothetical protein A1O9_04449 [Exophiala aquamarina CBS 119918]